MNYCIFMVVNNDFSIGAAVTIYSFLKNNSWFNGDIVIGYGSYKKWSLSDENKEMLSNIYHKTKFIEISYDDFYDIYDNLIPIAQAGVGFEMSVYKFHAFRLNEYDKVVIFDSDMLILEDVRELFYNDIEFGALKDVLGVDYIGDTFKIREKEYFNCGVMIVGKKWISEEVIIGCDRILKTGEIKEDIDIPHFKGLYVEQDLLNVFFKDKEVTLIPKTYSANRFYCDDSNYKDVKIIHYLTAKKPWKILYGEHKYCGWTQEIWEKYLNEYNDWLEYYSVVYDGVVYKFKKHYDDKDKYIVFTCVKEENQYIKEWVDYYLNLNFDKIIICDNNDEVNYGLYEILDDYINKGQVEIFETNKIHDIQNNMYEMFYYHGNYKWCAYFDCDEFLELNLYNDIKEYLKDKEGDCVLFNWLIFGSNGKRKKEDDLVQNRFKQPMYPLLNMSNSFVKSIVKGGHFKLTNTMSCNGHTPIALDETKKLVYNIGGYNPITIEGHHFQAYLPLYYKEGYLKHYYTKSFGEWIEKSQRGWPVDGKPKDSSRYFLFEDKYKPKREDYIDSAFITNEVLSSMDEEYIIEKLKNNKYFTFIIDGHIPYAVYARITHLFSKINGVTIIIEDDKKLIDEMLYTMILEAAFATGNKIVYVDNEKDIELLFKKNNDPLYYGYTTIM